VELLLLLLGLASMPAPIPPHPPLGATAHEDIVASGGQLVKIPIVDTYVRSLNQSVCVGVGVFEALRQLDLGKHSVEPRDDRNNAMVKIPTPMLMAQQQQQQGQQQLQQPNKQHQVVPDEQQQDNLQQQQQQPGEQQQQSQGQLVEV
jgi:hypothetical protein